MSKLAIHGGPKTVQESLAQPWPVYDLDDEARLLDVLRSRKWGRSSYNYFNQEGSKLFAFEKAFADVHDGKYALSVSTGTTALETCLRVLGVEAGCEVIVPASTYIASASCALICNAVPVFADIDPRNYTIDPRSVESLITPRTRAVVAVDFGGMPCDTDALGQICRKHGIGLVSDCAHAHGGQWRGKGVGSHADVAAYSCMPGKVLAIGEGAIVMTNSEALYESAFHYHHAGRERGAESQDFTWPATTLRMSEFEAAMGLGAISRLGEQADRRFANLKYLHAGMEQIPGLTGLEIDPRVTRWNPFRWHFKFVPEEFDGVHRDQFRKALCAEGVPCGIGPTKPLYTFSMFAKGEWGKTGCPVRCPLYQGPPVDYTTTHCPEAERIHTTEALDLQHTILLGPRKNMDLILDTFRKLRSNVDELRKIDHA
ncbi:MAG: DegT/DnrJ/EryC1/StrS family aminotransferase [Lentisphaerae bacterium]|jgi:dTDP-4-amino-4,6-dideoxygalactose transaminase|nr:DegT/DnrJ/EryC1/StrS family aminotransferase [Lentisphaerota bacterium]MBT5606391.1 DegT/DnrJ/EryC1/StrS family aminotransferase [Lentisphaerota bacterium]MBT7059757.1 DegT/DnrJ/EryC1/StrS family aminotransferase [Lentisphaerota bacterium]MBT7847877.1 DegT/DnrJ/EryC1/StrS family aminotransferase [Lentisphaerota bacterium]